MRSWPSSRKKRCRAGPTFGWLFGGWNMELYRDYFMSLIYKDSSKPTWWNVTRILMSKCVEVHGWLITRNVFWKDLCLQKVLPRPVIHQTNHYCWWWACWWSTVPAFFPEKNSFPENWASEKPLTIRPKFEPQKPESSASFVLLKKAVICSGVIWSCQFVPLGWPPSINFTPFTPCIVGAVLGMSFLKGSTRRGKKQRGVPKDSVESWQIRSWEVGLKNYSPYHPYHP